MEIGPLAYPLSPPSLGDVAVPSAKAVSPARPVPETARQPDGLAKAKDETSPRDTRQSSPAETDIVRRQITVDQATHRIVYQAIDTRTGEVFYQLPDVRYLKAYAEQIKAADELAAAKVERLA